MKDDIFAKQNNHIGDFIFDQTVTDVFNDMINRSVPGYRLIIKMLGVLAEQYAKDNTNIYDLGCSLGAGTIELLNNIKSINSRIIAVDNSEHMVQNCKTNIKAQNSDLEVEVLYDDIQNVKITNASIVVLNLSLQFILPEKRSKIIENIYNGLCEGGILFLTEKVVFDDALEDKFEIENYYAFKKLNGYSELEISQKRTALENVLIADTIQEHNKRLNKAGFSKIYQWFKCFNFVSMVAVKE